MNRSMKIKKSPLMQRMNKITNYNNKIISSLVSPIKICKSPPHSSLPNTKTYQFSTTIQTRKIQKTIREKHTKQKTKRKRKSSNSYKLLTHRHLLYHKPSIIYKKAIRKDRNKRAVLTFIDSFTERISKQMKEFSPLVRRIQNSGQSRPVMDRKWWIYNLFVSSIPAFLLILLYESQQKNMEEFYALLRERQESDEDFYVDYDKNNEVILSNQDKRKIADETKNNDETSDKDVVDVNKLLQRIEELERMQKQISKKKQRQSGIGERIERQMKERKIKKNEMEKDVTSEEEDDGNSFVSTTQIYFDKTVNTIMQTFTKLFESAKTSMKKMNQEGIQEWINENVPLIKVNASNSQESNTNDEKLKNEKSTVSKIDSQLN